LPIQRKISNYQHRFAKLVKDTVWHHQTKKHCAPLGSLKRNRRTDAVGDDGDQFFISDAMHFNSIFHKFEIMKIDSGIDNLPMIDLKAVTDNNGPSRRQTRRENRFKTSSEMNARATSTEPKKQSGNENRLEKACRSGFRSMWQMEELQGCPKLEKWKRRTSFLQGQIAKFSKLCRKHDAEQKERQVEQRQAEMIEIPGMGLVHPSELGVGQTTTTTTDKPSSNVTVSGDLIETDALGGLERSVSREQGSLLQTIDLTELGPDDALFYDDVAEESQDGIMSRNKAKVIGSESLVSEDLINRYSQYSDLDFSDVQIAAQKVNGNLTDLSV